MSLGSDGLVSKQNQIALITGASRGIGADIAKLVAQQGLDVIIGCRSKITRAEAVASKCMETCPRAMPVQADLTMVEERERLADFICATGRQLALLILNASGGLEKGKPASYAMDINCVAQNEIVRLLRPLMPAGSTIVFVTSHWSHFYGQQKVLPAYKAVAESKNAGEIAIRSRTSSLQEQGIRLIVVSGDIVEGTVTPKLLDRAHPGFIESRRNQVGALPTVEVFARATIDAAFNPELETGSTVFVGSTDLRIPQHFLDDRLLVALQ